MKKFTIIHNFTAVASIEVLAETREEAFQKAKENDLELSAYNFEAWTKDATKPITLWVESKNQMAARNQIMRENPFITKLMFHKSKRIE